MRFLEVCEPVSTSVNTYVLTSCEGFGSLGA